MLAHCIKLAGILLVLFVTLVYGSKSGDLRSVIVIFRHGDRVADNPYANDPFHDPSIWPVPFGQLTNEGEKRVFKLGQWLRNHYADFLSEEYSDNEIFVRSTDYNRTLMSARGVLSGLYSATDPTLNISQIPIFTLPRDYDTILSVNALCSQYYELYKQLYESAELVTFNQKNEGLYAYLSEHIGENIIDVHGVARIYDSFYCASQLNFTLPAWATSVFPDQMNPCALMFLMGRCYNADMARLKVGPLFNHIIQYFSKVINEVNAIQKFQLYSTHDTIIVNVLNSLNILKRFWPPYASSLLLELRNLNEEFYVNVLYRNATIPIRMTLENCKFDCPFYKFVEILKPIAITPEEYERECRVMSN